jgi:hypothetical protein
MRTMRRAVAGFTTFAVATLLLGCSDVAREPTGLTASGLPLLRDASANSAVTFTDNVQVPTTLVVFVSCANGGAGELIQVEGDLHILVHMTISSSGNLSVKQHFQPMGISGYGLTTGDKYQATGVTQDEFSVNAPLPYEETFINNFRMIGQGPGNNFSVHENFHITFNANGDVTAVQDNFNVDCK